jgi:phosphoribosyl-ATP pyrophosphohydrolase/phosphoribosyl-AMP cyclohydrolase
MMSDGGKRMLNIDELKFDEKGLIPAIVVDAENGKVLTLAYMNRESLQISMEKGLTCFWSRSRQELWLKGETSGNYQHIVSITADCDRDALVVKVEKDGPACHKGTESCFNDPVWESDERHEFTYEGLMELIAGRKTEKKEGSYTTYLFEKGLDKILKKVGEETTEVIIAAKDKDKQNTIYEIADLTYHVMVLMIEAGISLEDIHKELASRHVIDKKVKQEKMV